MDTNVEISSISSFEFWLLDFLAFGEKNIVTEERCEIYMTTNSPFLKCLQQSV